MSDALTTPHAAISPLVGLLRCVECGEPVEVAEIAVRPGYPELGPDGWLACTSCGERYPMIGGTPRMLQRSQRSHLGDSYPAAAISLPAEPGHRRTSTIQERTAESFAYEWSHFGEPRREWRKNFIDYMQPHEPEFFAGKLVLDVGAGSGRHAAQAAQLGAKVAAIDIGESIDVTRRNAPAEILTVQADAERLPFAPGTFDFVMSIGVLHHLRDPRGALKLLPHYVRPGGRVHVYLYWQPEVAWHRVALRVVTAARHVTVRLPHRSLHQLSYPIAAALWIAYVLPYRLSRNRPTMGWIAQGLPLKTYADYPFGVLVNDQFDRFSAPLERRYTRSDVEAMLADAGLEEIGVLPNHGWVAEGRVPSSGIQSPPSSTTRPGISVVVPIRDDRDGAMALLHALAAQTRPPDEVIIVDDGSTDGTRKLLVERQGSPVVYRIVDAGGVGIAAARNAGISVAQCEWIACTDAGCVPVPGWLEAVERASGDADFVAGVVIVDTASLNEWILAFCAFPRPDELDDPPFWIRASHWTFGRGLSEERTGGGYMAFRRAVCQSVGGFPPGLRASDDWGFSIRVARAGFRLVRARDATVHWRPRSTSFANLKMFFNYTRGGVRTRPRWRYFVRALAYGSVLPVLRRGRPSMRAFLGVAGLAYVWLPFHRAGLDALPRRHWWRILVIVGLKDLAQIAGAGMGVLDAIKSNLERSLGR